MADIISFKPCSARVEELSLCVLPYYTEKRYKHALEVADEAKRLGEIYLPDKIEDLQLSALLHDITKKDEYEKQLQYCEKFGIIFENGEKLSRETMHALTAAYIAQADFPKFVNDEIVGGVRWHTTGHGGMSVFEAIIYLADYIEPTRTFEGCIKLRKYFYDKLSCGCDKYTTLYDTMIFSFDMTISNLIEKGAVIDINTVSARNTYINLKKRTYD